jgi:hypothetical protein
MMIRNFICLLILTFCAYKGVAQNDKDVFFDIINDDRSAINALVLYPKETREAILQAAKSPEIIVKLENIQNQSREQFIQLIANKGDELQQNIYEMIRYNGLVNRLTEGGKKSEEEIKEILENYPSEIQPTAMHLGRKEYNLLSRINELEKAAQNSFNNVLSAYPADLQSAYRHLIELPEVIDILAQNMKMTVLVGDLFNRDPAWVNKTLDSLQLEAAKEQARETQEWKKRLEENPELLEEFKHSAETYAKENGFYEGEFLREQDQLSALQFHNYYSYPFWFGYPWWYPYSYWYRWPVWYDWGFYYGPGASIIITGMPSFYFTYWYLHHPRHHFYYPRLTDTFISHHQNHPRSTTGVSAGVNTWIADNRNVIPGNLLTDDGQRVERIRQFGLFETEYRERVEKRPGRRTSREEYLKNNSGRFNRLTEPGIDPETLEAVRPGREFNPDGERRVMPENEEIQRGSEGGRFPENRRGIEERGQSLPSQRESPIQRQAPVERQRPAERSMPQRSAPPAQRQAPAPRQNQPPAGSPQSRSARPGSTSLQITTPTEKQKLDNARIYHLNTWKR